MAEAHCSDFELGGPNRTWTSKQMTRRVAGTLVVKSWHGKQASGFPRIQKWFLRRIELIAAAGFQIPIVYGCRAFLAMTGQYIFEEYDGEEMTKSMVHALDRMAAHIDPEKHSKELASYGPDALAGVALAAASGKDVKLEILGSICAKLSDSQDVDALWLEFSAASLTKLCWALAVANHRDKRVMSRIGMEIASRSSDFSVEELAKCLAAFAEFQLFHEEMMPEISVQLMWKVDQLSARSLAEVAVACAKLEYCKQPLFDWLASRMCLRDDRTLDDISSMVWAFAQMSLHHEALCQQAAQDALHSDLTEQQHARLLLAFDKLDFPAQGVPRPLFHRSLSGAESVCKPRWCVTWQRTQWQKMQWRVIVLCPCSYNCENAGSKSTILGLNRHYLWRLSRNPALE